MYHFPCFTQVVGIGKTGVETYFVEKECPYPENIHLLPSEGNIWIISPIESNIYTCYLDLYFSTNI